MLTNAYEIPFALAAGASLVLPAGSFEFVYLSSVSAGASLKLKGSQVSIDMVVGRRVEFGNPTIHALTLENTGGGSVSGVLLVGSGNVKDSTVVGTVSVQNADKERTLSGVAFVGPSVRSAVAGRYGLAYLANPASSGVYMVVNKVKFSAPVGAGFFNIFVSLDYVAMEAEPAFSWNDSKGGLSKKVGAEDSVGLLRSGDSSAYPLVNSSNFESGDISAPGNYESKFTEPVVLSPGCAVGVVSRTVNETVRGNFEWFEEAI